ncbi:MAG: dihydrolipoamide acetyltransferase family protein [Steroidobacteraceae bacterium]
MVTKIPMPSGGTNTDKLRIVSWKKQVGDAVNRGDVLLEVETDKSILEVESFAKGTLLKQAIPEGDFAAVGDVIAYIGTPEEANDLDKGVGDGKSSVPPEAFKPGVFPDPPSVVTPAPLRSSAATVSVKATPAAKKALRDLGASIGAVHMASGKEVLRADDVARFAAKGNQSLPTQVTPFDLEPLSSIRRSIAERMQLGASVPTFSAEIEVDMSACTRLRSDRNARANSARVAYHDIIAKSVGIASRSWPLVNAAFSNDGIRVFRSVNVGIAVSVGQGLVVPVVNNVEEKALMAVAAENSRNIKAVRDGKFTPALLENGTVTISNLGGHAVCRFTAILNPPQSCILAIGAIQTRAVWREQAWREVPMMSITGTFDHRVLDGVYAAQFLQELRSLLQNPDQIFNP